MKILRTITTLMLLISFIFVIYACSGKTPDDPVLPDPPVEDPVDPDPSRDTPGQPDPPDEDPEDPPPPEDDPEDPGPSDWWDDEIGIQSAVPGDRSITITFGTATDPDGDAVKYRLFYIDETHTGHSDPFQKHVGIKSIWDISSPYTLTDLYNSHKYWLGVRAYVSKYSGLVYKDCGNTVKLSAIPEGDCSPGPVITTTELPEVIIGVPYNAEVRADRGHGKMAWYLDEDSVLPAGIQFKSGSMSGDIGCTLSGIPEEHGNFPLKIIVEDSCFDGPQTDSVSLMFTVLPDPGPHPDSNWKWARTWGGPENDSACSVTADDSGNVYITGTYRDTAEFNPDGGGEQTSKGGTDAYLTKFDSNGNWQWAKTWGGTMTVSGRSVGADNQGNVYVAGFFSGAVEFNPDGGGLIETDERSYDTFLSKFDSNGNWQWTKTWDAHSYISGSIGRLSIDADNHGNVYVANSFKGSAEFNPEGGGSQTAKGELGAYLSKFDTDGNWHWTKTWGGSDKDEAHSVAADDFGNVYVTGRFRGTAVFNPDGGDFKTAEGSYDAYLSKFDTDGNWQWTKTWTNAMGYSINSDNNGNVYVTGIFNGKTGFNPDGGGEHTARSWVGDAYLSKFDFDGNWHWAQTWGEINPWHGYYGLSVAVDNFGNAYLLTSTHSDTQKYLHKYDSNGNLHWTESWGPVDTVGYKMFSVAVDKSGDVYVAGTFGGFLSLQSVCEFNPYGGGAQTSRGGTDSFLTMFRDD